LSDSPLTFIQGDSFRAMLSIARVVPATPPVTCSVTGDTLTFAGTPGFGMTCTVTVTLPDASTLPYVIPLSDFWSLSTITGVVAAALTWVGNGTFQPFAAQAESPDSLTVAFADQGTTFAAEVTISSEVDLSTATAKMMIRKSYGSQPLITLTTGAGLTIDPVGQTIIFELTASQTAALPLTYLIATASSSSAYSSGASSSSAATYAPPASAIFPFDIEISFDDTGDNVGHTPAQDLTMLPAVTRP
jgi:hypothetical protein